MADYEAKERQTSADHDRFLRWPEVQVRTGICRSHAHALAARGEFPKPIKLGARASAWLASEIDEWVCKRIAMSRDSQAENAE